MKFEDWEKELMKDSEYVAEFNKQRGKRIDINYGIDITQPTVFIHMLPSRNGKYVLFVFWVWIFYLCVEIRYHKRGTKPWLVNFPSNL